jgi:uncharacterized protein (TIGR00730 family)
MRSREDALVTIRRICVFCGSHSGTGPAYGAAAASVGREIARRGWGLVYGGGRVGLMGIIADAALAGGAEVDGFIPEHLAAREVAHGGLTRLHVVASMHERKARMAALADAFLTLPGGLGTLEEMAETLTWAQLGLHGKPCAMLDVAGYFTGLEAFLDHAVTEGFVRPQHRRLLLAGADAAALLDAIERASALGAGGPPDLTRT